MIDEVIKILQNAKQPQSDFVKLMDNFKNPYLVLIACILSLRTNDKTTYPATLRMLKLAKTPQEMMNVTEEDLAKAIYPVGFYKNKAKNIKKCANQILENFDGKVPQNMDDLISLAGVGRKSANVIMLEVFGNAVGIAVDTHCKRISNRIGLSNEKDPSKIEQDLLKQIDPKDYKDVNHLFIWHGRYTCKSQKPLCEKCTLKQFCKYYNSNTNS